MEIEIMNDHNDHNGNATDLAEQLAEVTKERDELTRKLAEQQAIMSVCSGPCHSRLCKTGTEELTKLLEAERKKAVPLTNSTD